ncbi:ABC transporter permease [Nonomuraea sp. MG754425]|uniref:ABC transporter permease n=1 Tax=Nonomuraea sp. MG754425 TaxID=2570319 RepID=UPI001F46DE8E|nr:FtsX-like permease family protein [Nonomuraea sp. MG754425]
MSTAMAGSRWIKADLRARTGQAALTVLVVAGIVAALITAATLLEDSTNPWRSLSAQTDGAHVWLYTKDSPQVALGGIEGVTQTAGPYRSAPVTVAQEGKKEPATLRAMPATAPAVAHPVVAEGRWLDPSQHDGVVVERSFADALGLRVGAAFSIIALSGQRHTLYVRGIADSADQGFYPEWTPGLAYVLPVMLDRIEPMLGRSEWVTGLRLADPEASQVVSQRVVVLLEDRLQRVYTWREVRAAMELDNRLLGTLLALFGVVGLVAAALALANAAGGRVLGQLRDLATLKSMGFTRGQIALVLLVEHGALGLLGVAIGALAGWGVMAAMLGAGSVAPFPVLAIIAGTALVVLAAVGVPAWRGGRTPPILRAGRADDDDHHRARRVGHPGQLPGPSRAGGPARRPVRPAGQGGAGGRRAARPPGQGRRRRLLRHRRERAGPRPGPVGPGAGHRQFGEPVPVPRRRGAHVRPSGRGGRRAGAARPTWSQDRRPGAAHRGRHPADRPDRRPHRRARAGR